MKSFEDVMKEVGKPGSMARRLLLGLVFFVFGLMFVRLGFWPTLLVAALTALGYLIGSSSNLVESIKSLINKVFPPRDRTVTYSAEDIKKVQQALEKKDKPKDESKSYDPHEPDQDADHAADPEHKKA